MFKQIILIGPPGSGKGAQSKLLSKKLQIARISSGELLRSLINQNDKRYDGIKEIISKGNLLSDNVLIQIIQKAMKEMDLTKGLVADGFPRTKNQAIILNELKIISRDKVQVFVLKVNKEILEKRIQLRMSKEDRLDDKLNIFEERYKKFTIHSKEIMDYYQKSIMIDGESSIELVNNQILKYLE